MLLMSCTLYVVHVQTIGIVFNIMSKSRTGGKSLRHQSSKTNPCFVYLMVRINKLNIIFVVNAWVDKTYAYRRFGISLLLNPVLKSH